jgi:hypothetical protein
VGTYLLDFDDRLVVCGWLPEQCRKRISKACQNGSDVGKVRAYPVIPPQIKNHAFNLKRTTLAVPDPPKQISPPYPSSSAVRPTMGPSRRRHVPSNHVRVMLLG